MPAVFTIIQHEPFFFPLWYSHYARHFAPSEIHVLHHLLPAPTTAAQEERAATWGDLLARHQAKHRYHLIELVHDHSFDHEWLQATVSDYQRDLLRHHAAVLFAEVDEIVATHPDSPFRGLRDFIDLKVKDVAVCDGYEVVHRVDSEPALDPSLPVLGQRQWWYWSRLYSKPVLSRIPLRWHHGFHSCDEMPVPYHQRDRDLLLLHLHKLDWGICLARNLSNIDRKWKDDRLGFQNRLVAETRLRQWWALNIDQRTIPANLSPMPASIRGIV